MSWNKSFILIWKEWHALLLSYIVHIICSWNNERDLHFSPFNPKVDVPFSYLWYLLILLWLCFHFSLIISVEIANMITIASKQKERVLMVIQGADKVI